MTLPQPSQSSGAPSSGANAQPQQSAASSGGEVFDFKKAFDATRGELGHTKSALAKVMQEFDAFKGKASEATETVGKLKEVLGGGEKKKAPDPISQAESQLDYYLAEAVEAEKQGSPIPLTTNLAVQFFQAQIAAHKEKAELLETIKELKKGMERLSNPNYGIDTQAYGNFDSYIIESLDSLYGGGDQYRHQKSAQFQAVSRQIADALGDIQKNAPDKWDQIRRNPTYQRRLVEHFVKQNIPPAALQLIEQKRLQSEPMGTDELWQAFREAASIEDEGQRREIRSQIRQEILERMYYGRKNSR